MKIKIRFNFFNLKFDQLSFRLLVSFLFLSGITSQAAEENDQTFTLDGQLYQAGTSNPLTDSSVKIVIQVLSPDKTCILYEETQSNINLSQTNGYFNIKVGSPKTGGSKRTPSVDLGNTMAEVFQNTKPIGGSHVPGSTCISPTSALNVYQPSPGDTRYFRMIVTPSSGVADTLSPDFSINSVPSALVAETIQGVGKDSLIQADGSVSFSAHQSMNNHKITNLATPTAGTDAVTKDYVDTAISGVGGAGNAILADGTVPFTAHQSMGSHKITNLTDPTGAQDAATKNYVDTTVSSKQNSLGYTPINSAGDSMTGELILPGNPTSNLAATPKQYVDSQYSTITGLAINKDGSVAFTGDQSMGSYKITNLGTPTSGTDAATKSYVDTGLSGKQASLGFTPLNKAGDSISGTLTLATGTTTISPLNLPSGALLTTPSSGNIESNGTYLYWTTSTPSRQKLASYPEASTPADGQLLIGNGTGFSVANLTAGSGISITNSSGGISISSTGSGGSVTSVTSANGDISVATTTTTPVLTLNAGTTGGASDANKIPRLDSNGLLTSAMLPNFDIAKITSGTLSIARGGTNSTTALNNNRVMISSGGSIVETSAITANRAIASDANGIPTHTSVTSTELGYLSGVTSSVQTQIGSKASSSGWTTYSIIGANGSGDLTAYPGTTSGTIIQHSPTGPSWSSATYPSSTTANQLLYSSSNNVVGGLSTANNAILTTNGSGVPSWSVLSGDIFSQYTLLAGRSGGQTVYGGTAASNNLTLESTSNATKGNVIIAGGGGKVGIGTASPGAPLQVQGTTSDSSADAIRLSNSGGTVVGGVQNDGTFYTYSGSGYKLFEGGRTDADAQVNITNWNSTTARYPQINVTNLMGSVGAGSPGINLYNGRGNSSTTAPVQNGDVLGGISFFGFKDGSWGTNKGASIFASSTQTFSGTAAGTNMTFLTTPNNSTTAQERVRIDQNGNVGIGTNSPSAKLTVSGSIVSTIPSSISGSTVDLSLGNTLILTAVGGTSITIQNMVHGGTYTLVIQDTTSRQYTFSGCNSSKFLPSNNATTAGTQSIYTILTVYNGSTYDCYVTWATGYL